MCGVCWHRCRVSLAGFPGGCCNVAVRGAETRPSVATTHWQQTAFKPLLSVCIGAFACLLSLVEKVLYLFLCRFDIK